MGTIIKQLADGIILSRDNNFDTNLRKVFINNHEITDIDTFFKVAEENTRLLEQCKKQKEVIDKIKEICASIPEDWTICGVEKIYEIEETLKEVSNNE